MEVLERVRRKRERGCRVEEEELRGGERAPRSKTLTAARSRPPRMVGATTVHPWCLLDQNFSSLFFYPTVVGLGPSLWCQTFYS